MVESLDLVRNGKVKKIGENMWEVGEYMVVEVIKPGRRYRDCDCAQSSRFGHTTICKHKDAVVLFEALRELWKQK